MINVKEDIVISIVAHIDSIDILVYLNVEIITIDPTVEI